MQDLARYIRTVPDFPKAGIQFKDITTLLKDPEAFRRSLDAMKARFQEPVDVIVGIESRGFIFGGALAASYGAGFVPARKQGKLPAEVEQETYELEYGADQLEIHKDAIRPGQKVLIVDDLLATGGTAAATARLVKKLGGDIVGLLFLIELTFLNGREKLKDFRVESIIQYAEE
ncbi:MAG: adenine phosphoribosyltransferase [candidate division KSB1 bacterium]|nr:adenine phosphoribosyltransferase [candidate division KSB1 bacterium]